MRGRIGFAWMALMLVAAVAGAAARSHDRSERIWRGEDARVSRMAELLSRRGRPGAPPVPARAASEPASPERGAARRVRVSSSLELARALAGARAGDHIQLADGVYRGRFTAVVSGRAEAPIVLTGTRGAVIEGAGLETGYGFHLRADHWILEGFSIRTARKGIILDRASHNVLRGLEVHRIGEEGVHFRSFSSDNLLEGCWIHDVGRDTPLFGEGVYVGSAASNWSHHSGGRPDACDRNRIRGNVIGPDVTAEAVDVKEGTTGGEVTGNLFVGLGSRSADSWVDLKGNRWTVRDNTGTHSTDSGFDRPVAVHALVPGWGEGNVVVGHSSVPAHAADRGTPFRAASGERRPATLVLPGRAMPYRLRELEVCWPQAFERRGESVIVHEHVLAGPRATLEIDARETAALLLVSRRDRFVSLAALRGTLRLSGSAGRRLAIRSWDPATGQADTETGDGRAYVVTRNGRMDLERVEATDLGFGTGWTSGVAWKGIPGEKCTGEVRDSRFERNHFGAYTFEAESMRWIGNLFADNLGYGFDPHDFSNGFEVIDNEARGNGSHGIIFSRGCDRNLLRRNRSHSNRGHGIMLDDGKVEDDGDPRHERAVPSDHNRLEDNEVWGNDVGIALQGGSGNLIRANQVRDNQHGIRMHDAASGNEVSLNSIRGSRMFAIHVYNRSDRNRIVGNLIDGGRGGIVVKESVENVIEDNTITGIEGRGVVLLGDASDSNVSRNRIAGRGSRAIDAERSLAPGAVRVDANRTDRWMPPRGNAAAILLWATILLVPPLARLWVRWRRASRRTVIGLAATAAVLATVPAGAEDRALEVSVGWAASFDDNVLKYSDEQRSDLGSGLYPYRFGVPGAGDVVFEPSLALTWQQDRGAGRRRSIRLEGEGDLYRENGRANFAALGGVWREQFAQGRRLTLAYTWSPDYHLRRLYDEDLASLPSTDRYRDADSDLRIGSIAWRHTAPRVSWIDVSYRLERRRYAPEFRERDASTHQAGLGLGWERLPRAGRVAASAAYLRKDARAHDGDDPPGAVPDDTDLSYHGVAAALGGSLELGRRGPWRWTADGRYELERRRYDSDRPDDRWHYHRRDLIHTAEIGLRARAGGHWSLRGSYRLERSDARLGATAPPTSEIGSYTTNRVGLALEWTGELWSRPRPITPGSPR